MKFISYLIVNNLREQHQPFEQKLGKFDIKHFANLINEVELIVLFSNEIPKIYRILAKTIHDTFQAGGRKYSQSLDLYLNCK